MNKLLLVDPPVDSHFCSEANNPSFVEQPQNVQFGNCFPLAYIVTDIAFLVLELTRFVRLIHESILQPICSLRHR